MGINTLTPRYLNLDNDSRIIAAQEMIDAQNVRISADDDGNQGVVKNIAGNVNRTGTGLGYAVGVNNIATSSAFLGDALSISNISPSFI